MAKKQNALENAVKKQAANLDPAQREFVLAEFGTYQWNAKRIATLEEQLTNNIFDNEGRRDMDAEGQLFRQRHQLVAEQSSLFSHIMRWLKGTAVQESELDKFLDS